MKNNSFDLGRFGRSMTTKLSTRAYGQAGTVALYDPVARGSRYDVEREPRRIVPLDNIPLADPLKPAPQPLADPRLRLRGIG
jgi:hypothetical protein